MSRSIAAGTLVFLIIGMLLTDSVLAQRLGESVIIRDPVAQDLYAAGGLVEVWAPVAGDLTVAGREVIVEEAIHGDFNAVGERILLRGPVQDDIRVAGRRVRIAADIGDHMVAAGETVTIDPGVELGGFAWLAGSTLRLEGSVGQELKAVGQRVIISGTVGEDAEITAEAIEIRPGARIQGDLIWRSETPPEISGEAQIGGRVVELPMLVRPEAPAAAFQLFLAASLIAAGVVLYLLAPGLFGRAVDVAKGNPASSFGLGFLGLVLTPVAIVFLFITTVGSLLALILVALYLAAVPVAWIVGSFFVGELGLLGLGKREGAPKVLHVVALVLAILVLCLLQLIPVLGFLIGLAVTLFGLGALLTVLYRGEQAQSA